MNRTFLLSWLLVFVLWMAGSFLVHGTMLHAAYQTLTGLYRTDADAAGYFPFILLAHMIMSGAFVWIYARGIEAKPWAAQGIRFGIIIAIFAAVPRYLIYYAVQPMPATLVVQQIVLDSIIIVILGAAVAYMYRNTPRGA